VLGNDTGDDGDRKNTATTALAEKKQLEKTD